MRVGMLVLLPCLLAACDLIYDPIADVPHGHREVRTTSDAIALILAENPRPRVFAIGEYHESRTALAAQSPLTRFTREIVGLLEPYAQHIVVESWLDSNCWGHGDPVRDETDRPDRTSMEVMRLVGHSHMTGLVPHTLPMTCIELDSAIDASGHLDFLLLLQMVTMKLSETVRGLVADGASVIVYGGALHNDLYPRWPLEDLSYAQPLSRDLGGHVLEIDLVVPEVVAPMPMIRSEPWFPLLGRAAPDRVTVWQRGPASYVVILPAQSEDVARVAKLVDPR